MTPETLLKIMPLAGVRAQTYAEPLTVAMESFFITTPKQQAAFLAQVAHESGSLRYVKELADGRDYEWRKDLGNLNWGDGVRYKGRGLLQITGRNNYALCGAALGLDLLAKPELLEQPLHAARSAAWFWHSKGLNVHADNDRFGSITKTINGGFNGLDDRIQHWSRAQRVLGA